MPLLTKKLLFCDLETTGTDEMQHGIHQMAFQIWIGGKLIKCPTTDVAIFPSDKINNDLITEEDYLKNTNKSISSLRDSTYPSPIYIHKRLISVLGRYVKRYRSTDKFFFIGYNPGFDKDFLCEWFRKCGDKYFMSWIFWPPIDVAQMALFDLVDDWHKMKRRNLEAVTKHYAVNNENVKFHDAAYDIEMTKRIFFHILGQDDEA